MKAVALIPLRGGSKSIPKKNIQPLGGKPLFWWVTEACRHSCLFERIVVSTDSPEIASCVRAHFSDVEILDRPAALAEDTTSTEAVMLHFAEKIPFDVVCTVQATSPLLTADDLVRGWKRLVDDRLDSVVSGVRWKRFLWSEMTGRPLNYDPRQRPRRQDNPGALMENGAFYLTRRAALMESGCRLAGRIGVVEMPEESATELDEPIDWTIVEQLLRGRSRAGSTALAAKVRLVALDCDGTLTDAGMYYSAEGEAFKKFNTRDGKGIELLRNAGVAVAIITSEASAIVTARARKLQIQDDCFLQVTDKLATLRELCDKYQVRLDEVAYMGDDLNDLDCLRSVGFPCCPADAEPEVKSAAAYIAGKNGGEGAVREVAQLIVASRRAGGG